MSSINLVMTNIFLESFNTIVNVVNHIISVASEISWFYIINTLMVLGIIFFETQKTSSSSWAWILVLLVLPYVGIVIYLLLGRPIYNEKIFPYSKEQKIEYQQRLIQQELPYKINKDNVAMENNKNLISLNYQSDQAFLTEKNNIEIITDGNKKFELLFEDIKKAEKYIHIQYYILKKDNIGKELFRLLRQKLKEGVQVYILYDDIGSRTLNKYTLRKLIEAGAKTKSFFKSSLPLINLRMNFRNHRKIVVIDGKIGYVGGFNIGDEYLGRDEKMGNWRDTHLRIVGEAVAALNFRFIDDWNSQVLKNKKHELIDLSKEHFYNYELVDNFIPMQIVTSGPDKSMEQIKYAYLNMINNAKKYIYIQSPYFVPDESVMDALKMAILAGIDVRIMIPAKPDHPLVHWANYFYVGELVMIGAKIYEYENGFLHAKTIIIDDEVSSVGTANFDYRSFKLNFEINTFIYDNKTTENFRNIFLQDMEYSKVLTKEQYIKRGTFVKMKEAIAKLIAPIL